MTRRTHCLLFAGSIITLGAIAAGAAEPLKPEAQAQKAAESWLALVDGGQSAASWEQAAAIFRGAVSQDAWVNAVAGVRGPLGKLKSRRFKSAQYATSLPGAPDGEYVVIQFDSVFENKATAVETVTPMRDKDGQWRVSGYYIR